MLNLAFVLSLWIGPAALAQQQDVEASKDHALISRYPGSVIVDYLTKEFDEYLFPLGKLVDHRKPEKSQQLEGKVTLIQYHAPKGRSVLEIYRNFESALKKAGFEFLFTCANEGCGAGQGKFNPSQGDPAAAYWAQENQRHVSARLKRPEGEAYVMLHVQQMAGWEMAQIHLELIEMKPMEGGLVTVDAATLAGDLARTGHAAIYGIYFDTGKADVKPESDAALKEIAKLLQQDAALKLHVVGHTDSTGDVAMNMDLSRRRAAAVVQVLTTRHGIAAARLRPDGVGPLSPAGTNDAEQGRALNRRVELVKQ
ncbi:MAG: DUF4892 domain-containing protein [Acidobacteria bacterium]|nr:DUF4892 domain-containing protein [Acidobacteriota bacterium]